METAMQKVEGTLSTRKAAITYKIPRATLTLHLKNKDPQAKPGPSPVLSAEEEKLLNDWILDSAKRGAPRNQADIINAAQ
jgi:hypothetical protein